MTNNYSTQNYISQCIDHSLMQIGQTVKNLADTEINDNPTVRRFAHETLLSCIEGIERVCEHYNG